MITKYLKFSFFVYSMISFILNVLVKILMVVKQEISEWKKLVWLGLKLIDTSLTTKYSYIEYIV